MMYEVLLQIIETFTYNDGKIYNHQLKNIINESMNLFMVRNTQSLYYTSRICIRLWCYDGLSGNWLPKLWCAMTEQVPCPKRAKFVGRHMWTVPYQGSVGFGKVRWWSGRCHVTGRCHSRSGQNLNIFLTRAWHWWTENLSLGGVILPSLAYITEFPRASSSVMHSDSHSRGGEMCLVFPFVIIN